MKYYEIGTIVNTHGIKGEVKVSSVTDFDRYKKGATVYIKKNDEYKALTVLSHRVHKGFDLVVFEGLEDINKVLEYKGLNLYIDETEREVLDEDSFYYEDLIGLDVYNQNNVFIGVVEYIRELPQGAILDIKRDKKKNALVPFNDEFIISVDGKIIVNEIEGLL